MTDIPFDPERDLILTREVDAPVASLWRCWTEPAHLKQWFAPAPWTTPEASIDPRPGGAFRIRMQGPDGGSSAVNGCVLEATPNSRLVFTEVLTEDWRPAEGEKERPFALTVIVSFDDLGSGRSRYTAHAMHGDSAMRVRHEEMGFHEGWGLCADQLVALARTL